MRYRAILGVFLISSLFVLLFWRISLVKDSSMPTFFVGVDAVSEDVEDIKRLVDEVKPYTNLFVIGSTGITDNITKLDEVCQYIYESGLYFMTYMHISETVPQPQWVEDARQRWGNRFLGLYAWDEAGGNQIDCTEFMLVEEADNYTDAADKFVGLLDGHLKHFTDYYICAGDFPLFTADYALYWFDYKAGYDVVLCEFGWKHSRLLNVALVRGAAKMHDKDWGAIITWTYRHPPYMESGDELYYDMVLAYLNGAKYVVVFDHPMEKSWNETITEEHFDAMKRFWRYINANPRRPQVYCPTYAQTAYVLPKDYAWGFRGADDKVWGLWEDELSLKIGTDIDFILHTHHLGLDIIYDDPKYYDNMRLYSKLIFWNGTVITNENPS